MIILNDERFNNEKFCYVSNLNDIKKSKNNSTLIFQYNENDLNLYKFCQNNSIPYGVEIETITQFIFLLNLGAKYAICNNLDFAITLQKIADNYLSETKIVIKSKIEEIEKIALKEIDAIFIIK